MKKFAIFVLIVWYGAAAPFLLSAATAEGEGAKKLRSGNDRLTTLLLLSEHRKDFAVNDFAPGREAIRKAMAEAPGSYQQRFAAQNALRGVFEKALRAAYEQETAKMLNVVFPDGIPMDVIGTIKKDENSFLKQRSHILYERLFQEVRDELAQRQKADFFRQIHPTAAELEKFDDPKLVGILIRRYRELRQIPLWEENLALMQQDPHLPAIANGRAQQQFQLKLAGQLAVPARLWNAAETENFLSAAIRDAAAKRFAGSYCYPLFEKTTRRIRQRAKDLPLERAVAALPHHLDADAYRTLIERDPLPHRAWIESCKIAVPLCAERLKTQALERSAPPDKVKKTLEKDPRLEKAARIRVESLKREWQLVRQELSRRQLAKAWPELVAGRWLPPPEAVEKFAASGSREIPAVRERPDTAKLLQETEVEMERQIREQLTREVARLEAQRRCVEELYDEVLNHMAARNDDARERGESWFGKLFGSRTGVELKEVVQFYAAETEKRSSAPLFPSIVREIEVRARAIMQQLKKMAPAQKESPNPKKPKKKMILTLKLAEKNGRLQLSCGSWQVSFTDGQLPKAALKKELERRFAENKEVDAWQLRLVVNRDRIYYSTVSELRTFLKESLKGAMVEDSLLKP